MCLIYSVSHYNHVTRKLFQIYFSHICTCALSLIVLPKSLEFSVCSEMFLVHGIFCSLFPFDYLVHGDYLLLSHPCYWI